MNRVAFLIPTLADLEGSSLWSAAVNRESAALAATLVALAGVQLCWRGPRYRMSMEERAKDGALTNEQARRKIRFMGWFGPALALTGCALLALAVLR